MSDVQVELVLDTDLWVFPVEGVFRIMMNNPEGPCINCMHNLIPNAEGYLDTIPGVIDQLSFSLPNVTLVFEDFITQAQVIVKNGEVISE